MAREKHPPIPEREFSELYRTAAQISLGEPFAKDELVGLLYGIYRNLVETNTRFNLTAVTEPSAVVEKHLIDSLIPAKLMLDMGMIGDGDKLLDIGSGAGFPSLPIAAAVKSGVLPSLRITALDSTAKKVRYIGDTADMLGFDFLDTVCARAEEFAHGDGRESYDVVTARAVSALPQLTELSAPFVRECGMFAAMKANAAEEVAAAERGAAILGFGRQEITEYTLPSGDCRSLVLYKKLCATPGEYPRAYAKISSNPL